MDQEDVAFLFRQRGLVSAPVVEESGRLVGAIDVEDIVHVIDEENGRRYPEIRWCPREKFLRSCDRNFSIAVLMVAGQLDDRCLRIDRYRVFDAAIEKLVALAILMSIVASRGGNAGT